MIQQNQDKEFFFSPKSEIKNASWFRAQARGILKPHFWMLIIIALVAALLGGTSAGVSISGVFDIEIADDSTGLFAEEITEIVPLLMEGEFGTVLSQYPFVSTILTTAAIVAGAALLYSLFIGAPVELGHRRLYLGLIDGEAPEVKGLFGYFKRSYGKAVLARLLMTLIRFAIYIPALLAVCQVGYSLIAVTHYALMENEAMVASSLASVYLYAAIASALLIAAAIFGIVISLRYAYVTLILAEYPELGVIDAFRNSASLMKGNKWRLFCLQFSFIGWSILAGLVPYGLGTYILMPYTMAAETAFYHEIARRGAAEETEFPSLDPNDYDPNAARW